MHIGILQAGHMASALIPVTGDYPDLYKRMLAPHGFSFDHWDVTAGQIPAPDDAEGWLISGSRHGAYDDLPWIAPLENVTREIAASGRPLVGICFGHQIVAQALGGRVEKAAVGWVLGAQPYVFEDGARYMLNAWHQDQVVTPPPGARTISSTPTCPHAAFEIGKNVLTVQPHPEFDATAVAGLLEARRALLPEGAAEDVRARLDTPTDEAAFAARIADFYRNAGKGARDVA